MRFNLIKRKHKHQWRITQVSNVIQLDDFGYPLRLCIKKCDICEQSKQVWLDVGEEALKELETGESVLCEWRKICEE